MYLNSKEQDRRIIFEFLNEEFSNEKKNPHKQTHRICREIRLAERREFQKNFPGLYTIYHTLNCPSMLL